jgi:hypothetical protein
MLRQGVSKLIVAHAIAANIAMMDPDLPMIVSAAWLREHHVARLLFHYSGLFDSGEASCMRHSSEYEGDLTSARTAAKGRAKMCW